MDALSQGASIASLLIVVVPAAVPIVGAVLAFSLGQSWVGAFAAGGAAMVVVLVLVAALVLPGTIRRVIYGFRYRRVEITLELDARGGRIHSRTTRVAIGIVRTGIRTVKDRYCAPGPRCDGRLIRGQGARAGLHHEPRVRQGTARVVALLWDANDECWNYQLDLGAPLAAGAEREVVLEQNLDFRGVAYEPRLQRTVLDPTDHLVLRLRLPDTHWPLEVEGEEILKGGRPKRLPVVIDAEHREVYLEVRKPEFGGVYRLRWSPVDPGNRDPIRTVQATTLENHVPA